MKLYWEANYSRVWERESEGKIASLIHHLAYLSNKQTHTGAQGGATAQEMKILRKIISTKCDKRENIFTSCSSNGSRMKIDVGFLWIKINCERAREWAWKVWCLLLYDDFTERKFHSCIFLRYKQTLVEGEKKFTTKHVCEFCVNKRKEFSLCLFVFYEENCALLTPQLFALLNNIPNEAENWRKKTFFIIAAFANKFFCSQIWNKNSSSY